MGTPGEPGLGASAEPDRSEHWRQMERSYGGPGIHATFGLTLEVVGPGEVVIHLGDGAAGTNSLGTLAGGLLAQMIDSAVVQSTRTMLEVEDRTSTVELKVNFLRPADARSVITAHGRLLDLGGRLAVGSAEIRDAADRLLCAGLATVRIHRGAGAS